VAGNRAGATVHIRAAIAIERSVFGDEHDRVLANFPMLPDLLEVQEQFEEANAAHTEIIAAFSKRYGPDHWQTVDQRIATEDCVRRGQLSSEDRARLREATTASGKVNALCDAGQFSEALKRATFVVERRRELIGEKNSTYALSLAKLAIVHTMLGNFATADSLYEQSLVIEKETLGERHPEYAQTLSNLAVQCDELGQYLRAESLYEKAVGINLKAFGSKSAAYGASLNNLAVHSDRLGDFEKAETLYLEAIETYRQTLGDASPETLTATSNFCRHLLARGELTCAEPLILNLIDQRRTVLGDNHPQYAESLNLLGLLFEAKHEFARAAEQFQKALAFLKQVYGEQNPGWRSACKSDPLREIDRRVNRTHRIGP